MMNTHMLCTPMTFSNTTVSICGKGFWMDMLLGHNFFHLISRWCVLEIPWTHTAWALGRCAIACLSKHVVFCMIVHHLILLVQFEVIWIKDLGMDRLWCSDCLACRFTQPAPARLHPVGPHEEFAIWDSCEFRGRPVGTNYGCGRYWTTRYWWLCVQEHGM